MQSRTRAATCVALGPALLAAGLLLGCGNFTFGPEGSLEVIETVPGELLVGVRASPVDRQGLEARLNQVGRILWVSDGVYRIQLSGGASPENVAAHLIHPDIVYAEPNYLVHLYSAPNDEHWTAAEGPQYGAAVKAQLEYAWDHYAPDGTYTAASPLQVALLDTGVRASHVEFGASSAKLSLAAARNEITGLTWAQNAAALEDDNGHGTACASIIVGAAGATVAGGATGMLGFTSWNGAADPGIVKVVPFKVLGADGKGNHAAVARGIADAVAAGAKIISMSFGGAAPSWTLQNAIQRASAAGVLVIAAAGNDGASIMRYPAAYQASNQLVLSVGSVDNTDALSPDSNHGTWVNLLGPGVAVNAAGTTPALGLWAAGASADDALTRAATGTSISAAFVAGAAALIWTQASAMTAAELRSLLVTSVDSYDHPSTKAIAPGGGRLNVERALASLRVEQPAIGPQ